MSVELSDAVWVMNCEQGTTLACLLAGWRQNNHDATLTGVFADHLQERFEWERMTALRCLARMRWDERRGRLVAFVMTWWDFLDAIPKLAILEEIRQIVNLPVLLDELRIRVGNSPPRLVEAEDNQERGRIPGPRPSRVARYRHLGHTRFVPRLFAAEVGATWLIRFAIQMDLCTARWSRAYPFTVGSKEV